MRKSFLALALSALLSACAPPQPPAIEIKADSYCEIAAKVRWSKADTPETVKQVVRENAKHDRVCGKFP